MVGEIERGTAKTDEGYSIDDIWNSDSRFLEKCHVHIQWLFPSTEASLMHPDAPVLEQDQIDEFKNDPTLKARLVKSLLTMLKFYHLALDVQGNQVTIRRGDDFMLSSAGWVKKHDHNYLRLTRMLKCMMLLGLPEYALALYRCLEDLYKEAPYKFTPDNLAYWKDAAGIEPLSADMEGFRVGRR